MTIITIPAEIEIPLAEEARRRGTSPECLALETLRERFAQEPAQDLEEWYRELQELGPAEYEPGEWDRVQAILSEADEQAKALVRREMGLQ